MSIPVILSLIIPLKGARRVEGLGTKLLPKFSLVQLGIALGILMTGLAAACGASATPATTDHSANRQTPQEQTTLHQVPDATNAPPASTRSLGSVPASGPVTLEEVARLEIGPSFAVTGGVINGTPYAFLGGAGVVRAIDLSAPEAPKAVGEIDVRNGVDGLFLDGERLYETDSVGSRLRIIDVSDPASPRELGFADIEGAPHGIFVQGNRAFVTDGGGRLWVMDVSNPAAPRELGTVWRAGETHGVFVQGDYVFISDALGGLRVMDVSNPTTPVEVASPRYAGGHRGDDISVQGNYAYVADGAAGLLVVDVSDPTSPRDINSIRTTGEVNSVFLQNSYAFVIDQAGGLWALDVSDPTSPREAGFVHTPGYTEDLFVLENYALAAYVTGEEGGLVVVAVSGPP